MLSRAIIVATVALAVGSLFFQPTTWWQYVVDTAVRAYLMFVGTVMAHDATHGHLARTRSGNAWWGRLALMPVMVSYSKFRRTHLLHHAHTNEPNDDPDYILAAPREWEIPFRALAVTHHWLFWLKRRKRLDAGDLLDHLINGAGAIGVYVAVGYFVGWQRVVLGVVPPCLLVSLFLWYPFAVKTHEGFSTGDPESRSHNYYGLLMFWISCGLSMHRVHHMHPSIPWLALRRHVRPAPGPWWRRLIPRRDIKSPGLNAGVAPSRQ